MKHTPTILKLIAFCFSLFVFTSYRCSDESAKDTPKAIIKKEIKFDTVSLAIVGDLMCHSQQYKMAKTDSGYDFNPTFAPVKKYLADADFTLGNLETVTAGAAANFTGFPMFNTPVEYLDALKNAGFDVLTNSNNHSLDRGFMGVEKTIVELDKRGLLHTGTARTVADRNTPLILKKNNTKLGVLAYTYGTNGIPIPKGKDFCVNLIDTLKIKTDIQNTKKSGADVVMVFVHWGNEYQRYPSDSQKMVADYIHKNGGLLVFGSHPHVLQPTNVKSPDYNDGFTIYSMGNFVSSQRKQYTDCGIIVKMKLIKNIATGEVTISSTNFVPTYVSTHKGFRILPVFDALEAINAKNLTHPSYTHSLSEQARIKEVWGETTKHMTYEKAGFTVLEK
jgi:poly-gamma-glutamate capsule biosynthesis protein CapA/YwtB (metallophosphatase superfamily)